jgi:hypothetical protein
VARQLRFQAGQVVVVRISNFHRLISTWQHIARRDTLRFDHDGLRLRAWGLHGSKRVASLGGASAGGHCNANDSQQPKAQGVLQQEIIEHPAPRPAPTRSSA